MSNFMKAFDEQRDSYLAHYGVKGMQWGVRNEEQLVRGNYDPSKNLSLEEINGWDEEKRKAWFAEWAARESYSHEVDRSMRQTADKVKQASPEDVKEKRKRIVKNIVKGVAIGAIVAGITVGGVKGYAKKQTGEEQDLATSIGIIGQNLSKAPGDMKSKVEKGFNMNLKATLGANKAAKTRKRNENIAKTKETLRNLWFNAKTNPRRFYV